MTSKNPLRDALGTDLDELGISDILSDLNRHQKQPSSSMFVRMIAIEQIGTNPYQPRRHFDEDALQQLSQSIQEQGLLQPIVVRSVDASRYQLVAGERRWRACKMANISHIPAVVRNMSDKTAHGVAIVENIQREQLNVIELATSLHHLGKTFGLTHGEIGKIVGKSRASVSNLTRLIQLCTPVQDALAAGKIDMGHARCLLTLDESAQKEGLQLIMQHDWSVRQVEQWLQHAKAKESSQRQVQQSFPERYHDMNARLTEHLGLKTTIAPKRGGKSIVSIAFNSVEEIERFSEYLRQHRFVGQAQEAENG